MADWEYRAYDSDLKVHIGNAEAKNFNELLLKLRQGGLQVIDATKLSKDCNLAAVRFKKMQQRVAITEASEIPIPKDNKSVTILSVIADLLLKLAAKVIR